MKPRRSTVFQADEGDRWMLVGKKLLIFKEGVVRVTLAGRQYDAGTGATVFIPHGNWIGVENAFSAELAMIFMRGDTGDNRPKDTGSGDNTDSSNTDSSNKRDDDRPTLKRRDQ